VSYHHVWFSQNARAYTALQLFALVGSTLFLRLCRGDSPHARRDAFAYAAVMTLAVYSHLTAGVVVAAHGLVWLVAVALRMPLRAALRSPALLALLLAGVFSLMLYAPGLPDIVRSLGGSGPQVEIAWKNPLWMLTETVRGLAAAVPGGVASLAVAAILPVAGVLSFGMRDRIATALMIVPGVLTAALLLSTGHNLWPRFFFFAAGFAVLILVRGVFVLAETVLPRRAHTLATALLCVMIAGSAALVPRAWGAKQDFTGALDYIEQRRSAGDVVATVGLVGFTYESYLGQQWTAVESEAQLNELAVRAPRVWLVYAMPELIEAHTPELWSALNREFRRAAAFPGTLSGGTIHVMVRE
jgi:uncharacterized membrane protein